MTLVGKRRKARELAMQMLFQADIGRQNPDEVLKHLLAGARRAGRWNARVCRRPFPRGHAARQAEIDALLEEHSKNWRVSRMPAVDRNLLRMAVAELLGFPGTPAPIVIDEALEMARRYSAPESIDFLNAVLDAIARR